MRVRIQLLGNLVNISIKEIEIETTAQQAEELYEILREELTKLYLNK